VRLVIAEKHSVAVAIAQALGTPVERDGYIETDDGVMVSWAQGHLVELADPEAYEGEAWASREWSMDTLPVDPRQWRWRVSGAKGASARFKRLVALIRDPGVDGLVNACDPGRVGADASRQRV
jgi:DNA topoisomerase-3